MLKNFSFALVLGFVLLPLAAQAADVEKGKAAYAARCSSCHGVSGAGDGPVAQALPPGTVRNLATGPFKFATDAAKLTELLHKGGAGVGLNPLMPAQAGVADDELANIVAYTMSLRK